MEEGDKAIPIIIIINNISELKTKEFNEINSKEEKTYQIDYQELNIQKAKEVHALLSANYGNTSFITNPINKIKC